MLRPAGFQRAKYGCVRGRRGRRVAAGSRESSWRVADFDQRVEAIPLFSLDAAFFVGAADGAVIAHGAGAGLRSGRQETFFDGAGYRFEDAAEAAARFFVERDIDGRE